MVLLLGLENEGERPIALPLRELTPAAVGVEGIPGSKPFASKVFEAAWAETASVRRVGPRGPVREMGDADAEPPTGREDPPRFVHESDRIVQVLDDVVRQELILAAVFTRPGSD